MRLQECHVHTSLGNHFPPGRSPARNGPNVAPDQSSAWPTRCQSSGFSPAKSFVDVLVGTAPPRMLILPFIYRVEKNHPKWFGLGNSPINRILSIFNQNDILRRWWFLLFSSLPGISYTDRPSLPQPWASHWQKLQPPVSAQVLGSRWWDSGMSYLVCNLQIKRRIV